MWCSCPVSSNTMTDVDRVWVAPEVSAAAATMAYAGGGAPWGGWSQLRMRAAVGNAAASHPPAECR